MEIRIYRHGDHAEIAEIFTRAIHETASECYSPEQCLAWSDPVPNPDHWRKRCELKRPFVAVSDHRVAGFLELDTDGHIDCLYVHPGLQRRGIATRLVQHAIGTCFAMRVPRLYVEASYCAKPLFEKLGFSVIAENLVRIRSQELNNFRMELLAPPQE
jgi:putative acetyltransferase